MKEQIQVKNIALEVSGFHAIFIPLLDRLFGKPHYHFKLIDGKDVCERDKNLVLIAEFESK